MEQPSSQNENPNKALQVTAHNAPNLNADVGSENNGNCTTNGHSPNLDGKSIDRAGTISESEARNSQ